MKNGLKKSVVAGAAAIAVVGSLAGAMAASARTAHKVRPAVEQVAAVDADNIQSGDQTSPDTAKSKPATEKTSAVDTDNIQSGDQTSPDDSKGTSESSGGSSSENGGEAGGMNDGPGGWQDPAGANVNNEQSGSN
jgi:hypothetical protein